MERNGYCLGCHQNNAAEQVQLAVDAQNVFNDINKIHSLRGPTMDIIPMEVIHDFSNLLAWNIRAMMKAADDNDEAAPEY